MTASIQKLATKSHFVKLIETYGVFISNSPQSDFYLERENRMSENVYSLSGTFVLGRFIIYTGLKLHLPSNRLSVYLSLKDQQSNNQVTPYAHDIVPEHLVPTILKKDFMASEIKKAMKALLPEMKVAHFRTLPFTRHSHDFSAVAKELQLISSKRGYLTFRMKNLAGEPSNLEIGVGTPLCQVTSLLRGTIEDCSNINNVSSFGLTLNLPYTSLNEDNILVTILMDFAKVVSEPRRDDLLDL